MAGQAGSIVLAHELRPVPRGRRLRVRDWRCWLPGALVLALLAAVLTAPGAAVAQDKRRWVGDDFEVTLRTGQSTRNAIVRMLSTGAEVELIETGESGEYSRVRLAGGTEGWILSRYLVASPPARLALPAAEERLAAAQQRAGELDDRVRELTAERDELARALGEAESGGASLSRQLEELRSLSANTVQLNEQNKRLKARLAEGEQALASVEEENRRLASRGERQWFLAGAAVLAFGLLLGLILPRSRWRRKSSWDSF